jgi:chromatin segregation and condensation protein Rec8/ScpA/Scc1 (kleisin family)
VLVSHQPFIDVEVIFNPPSHLTLEMFKETLANLFELYQKERIILPTKKIKILVNLKDRINNLMSLFKSKDKYSFKEILGDKEDKINLVVTFLAILHLAKDGFLTLDQENNFGEIDITANEIN